MATVWRRYGILITAAVALAAMLGGGAVLFVHSRLEQARALDREIAVQAAAFAGRRWMRPPLGGVGRDCNGFAEAMAAVEPLVGVDVPQLRPRAFDRWLAGDQAPSAALSAAADAHRGVLGELRQAADCRWAWRPEPLTLGRPMPPYDAHLAAVRLLAVRALDAPPDVCLAIAADIGRLAQDLVAGGGALGLQTKRLELGYLAALAARCAPEASAEGLERALARFEQLWANPPPVGSVLEHELLMLQSRFARYTARVDALPDSLRDLQDIVGLRGVVSGWSRLRGDVSQLPLDLRRPDYPEGFQAVIEWDERHGTTGHAALKADLGVYASWIGDDLRGERHLAATLAGLRWVRAQRQGAPAVSWPVDPATGAPMAWRVRREVGRLIGAPAGVDDALARRARFVLDDSPPR